MVILALVMLLLTTLKMNYEYSRLVLFGGLALSTVVILSVRSVLRFALSKVPGSKPNVMVVCGTTLLPDAVRRHLTLRSRTHNLVGAVLPPRALDTGDRFISVAGGSIEIMGGIDDLDRLVSQFGIQQVDFVLHGLDNVEVMDVAATLEGRIPFMTVHPDPADVLLANSEVMVEAGAINLHLHQNLVNPLNRLMKRFFDIIFSFLALVLLSPVYVLLALLIKLDSSGPVFYTQRRLGQHKKHFGCLKFRTMAEDAEERLQAVLDADPEAKAQFERDFKLKKDPRITRVGNFLRQTSLDELPQFLNVLQGTMSVVGPRPIVDGEVEKYDRWGSILFRVKPGVTGLWQVSGRNDVTYHERIMFDRFYVKNWSFRMDFTIIIKTVFTVLLKRGAY
jgi:Undecaprenyl-phosphate galactose phosphotransferase WbaP